MSPTQPTHGWTVGRLWGARVIIQPSSILMIVVLAFLLGSGGSGNVTGSDFVRGAVLALLLTCSVFLHELGHALAARMFHRKVTQIVVTLWGAHTTFDAKDITPAVSGLTAFAGPLVNGYLALAAWGISELNVSGSVHDTCVWLIYANVVLGLFNVLPGIPMDGGRVLEAIVWRISGNRMTGVKVAAWSGRIIALAYLGYVLEVNLVARSTPNLVDVMWALLIFSILWPSATMSLKAAVMMEKIEVATVARVMRGAVGVPFDVTLTQALETATGAEAEEVVILAADGSPAGHFSVASAAEVPVDLRATTLLSALTIPVPRGTEVAVNRTGPELLEHARQWWGKTDALVVVDEGQVVGIVRLAEVSERLG